MAIRTSIFLLLFCFAFTGISQSTLQDDFEGNGNISTWAGDNCLIDTGFPNPYTTAKNLSATVLRYEDTGGLFANVRFDAPENLDLSTNASFTVQIYIPSSGISGNQPNQLSLKLQDGTLPEPWITQSEIIKPVILDQWQTLTFDFANDNFINLSPDSPHPVLRTDFNRVLFQVNGENNTDPVLAFIDEVQHPGDLPPSPVFDQLIWADEFDGQGAIDSEKWFHQTLLPFGTSWFNGEIQHYTDRIENSRVENGSLKIEARRESFTDQGQTKEFTSARLNSKFTFQYGRVEIRAKLPTGPGTWPALWMLGKNINEDGGFWDNEGFGTTPWPACGEIDIMEHWGTNPGYISSATHTPSSFGNTVNVGAQILPTYGTEFHIYSLEWTPEKLVFAVDGIKHFTYNPPVKNAETWPFDDEMYLLFNVAILPSIEAGFTSSAMEVDYVRIYQQTPVSTQVIPASEIRYFPNPVKDTLMIELGSAVNDMVTIRLFDPSGRLVKTVSRKAVDGTVALQNWEQLPAGTYLVQLQWGQQQSGFSVVKQ